MGWTKLYIPHGKDADKLAARFFAHLSRLHEAAGSSQDSAAYHIEIATVGHVYYLCPAISTMAESFLREYGEVAHVDPPSLKELTKLDL